MTRSTVIYLVWCARFERQGHGACSSPCGTLPPPYLGRQGQHVIQLVLALVQQAVAVHAAHERVALEDALGVLLVQREQGTSSIANLAQHHLHAPQLTLVAQAILADQLQLSVQALLLIRAPGLLEGLAIYAEQQTPQWAGLSFCCPAQRSSSKSMLMGY